MHLQDVRPLFPKLRWHSTLSSQAGLVFLIFTKDDISLICLISAGFVSMFLHLVYVVLNS